MKKKAFKAALPYTLPICVGFLFLGMSYGFLMRSKGFSFWYPLFMSMFIYAGSMEFVTANLLLSAFNPLYAFLLALMVNARHLFYGISMLDKYKNVGWKKFYLIYGMCDESFSINCTTEVPEGLEFVMTALFVVMFVERWESTKDHSPALIGLIGSAVCLFIFGKDSFIVPAMVLIILCFLYKRKADEKRRRRCSNRTSGCFLPERCTGKYHLRHPGTAGNYLYLQLFNG